MYNSQPERRGHYLLAEYKPACGTVSNATQGIEVTVFSADDGNDTFITTEVTNHFLPSECGVNYQLCNLLVVGQFLIIPANRSLIIYPLQTNTASHSTMIQNIPIDCNPTGISTPFQDSSLVVECRNTADHSLTYLFLSISETCSTYILMLNKTVFRLVLLFGAQIDHLRRVYKEHTEASEFQG